MPGEKSAKKRMMTSEKARIRNKARRSAIKTSEKKLRNLIASSDLEQAKKQLIDVTRKLDKAVKFGTIHKNARNRKKSRLTSLLSSKK